MQKSVRQNIKLTKIVCENFFRVSKHEYQVIIFNTVFRKVKKIIFNEFLIKPKNILNRLLKDDK